VAAPCAPWHCVRGPVRNGGSGRPFNGIVRGPEVLNQALAQIHPVLMTLFVTVIWFVGAAFALVVLAVANFPGINQHGTGTLFFLVAFVVAAIGTVVHIVVVLRRRRATAS